MLWAIYGILHSMLRAAFVETCRINRIDGWRLGFWQALTGFVVLLPLSFTPLMVWPQDGFFYMAAAGIALIFTIGMIVQLRMSEGRHGRIFAIYVPLEAIAAMIIWVIVTPYMLETYINDTLMTVSVTLAFAFSSYALFRIRTNDVDWKTFLIAAPIGITYAVAGVVTKIVMTDYGDMVVQAALSYVMVIFSIMTVVMGLAALVKKKTGTEFSSVRTVSTGMVAGLFAVLGYGTFVVSVSYAPNPGYTSMLAMLVPVWILTWHGFLRMDDKASPLAALFIVISMLLLIVSSH